MKRNAGETAWYYSLESRTRQRSGERGHNHTTPEEAFFAQVSGMGDTATQDSKQARETPGRSTLRKALTSDAAALRRATAGGRKAGEASGRLPRWTVVQNSDKRCAGV